MMSLMKFRDLKIGVQLSLAIFVTLFILSSVFYITGIYIQDKLLKLEIRDELRHTKDMFCNLKERDTRILASALDVFLENQDFKKVYLEGDREKLFQYGQPLFQKLKADYGITHFYFILPDGRCFVRLHNKDIYGDRIDRVTFKQSKATQELAAGIELGKTAFALRAVKPYYQNNELIGYVEAGEEIEHFLKILKGGSGDEFAIIADKEYMGREDWAGLRRIAGLKDNWDDMSKHVLIAQTSENTALSEFFVESSVEYAEKGPLFIKRIQVGNKFFAGNGFPLSDPNGRDIGVMLALNDITDFVVNAQRANSILLGITAILFILGILFFGIFILKVVIRPIRNVRSGIIQISQGDLNKKLKVESGDEIGELAELFNKMAVGLNTSRDELIAVRDYTDSIIASMIDSLIVVNPNGTIRRVNKATLDLLGYAEVELIGQPVGMIFAAAEEELFKGTRLRKLIQEGSVQDFEMTYKTKSGEKIPVSFSGSVIYEGRIVQASEASGRPSSIVPRKIVGVVGVARDMRQMFNLLEELKKSKAEIESYGESLRILVEKKTKELKEKVVDLEEARRVMFSILEDTDEARKNLEKTLSELKLTQEQLIQAGKLAGIGQMAAGVAHEINNPLTSIMGFAQLTLSRNDLDDTLRADLLTIEKEAKRCVTIIENLLSFARPQEPQNVELNINNVIEATLKVVEYSIAREKIEIVKKYAQGLPAIEGNPSQLQQVFMNIILNAVHAMPRGGTLTIETRAAKDESSIVHHLSSFVDKCVSVSFTDTGVGIPDENKAKIFEPFFTTSYKAGYKGTGLGLSISHSIVHAHHGRIEVESEVGKGSTFRVMLPV